VAILVTGPDPRNPPLCYLLNGNCRADCRNRPCRRNGLPKLSPLDSTGIQGKGIPPQAENEALQGPEGISTLQPRCRLAKWLDEGIAEYISTSRIIDNRIALGQIDTNTYPTWWLSIMATAKSMDKDKENLSFIPLRRIITGRGGPEMGEHFNLYYVHWWSFTHFLFHHQGGRYQDGTMQLIRRGGGLADFVEFIGPVEDVEQQWYAYVLRLKNSLRNRRTPAVQLTAAAYMRK
jgi:hypothetical protein